ncbi:hypothetical protein ABE137_24430 [Brevibacillus laterosporus]|uniref:hypothetical protein n=1 Tax=Brevibacillus laterosporus TaxID=1465 RepID=UPI003D1D0DB8
MRKSAIVGVLFIIIGVIGCVGWVLQGGIYGQKAASTIHEKTIEHTPFKQLIVVLVRIFILFQVMMIT